VVDVGGGMLAWQAAGGEVEGWPERTWRFPLAPALLAVTLGLAPFSPEPHLVEKLRMLSDGTLTSSLDLFDLLFHAAPWVWFAVALVRGR
jgi:hypothetical protein